MHVDHVLFMQQVSAFLGPYYLTLALLNAIAAAVLTYQLKNARAGLISVGVSFFFVILSAFAWNGLPPGLPQSVRDMANVALTGNRGAVIYTLGTTALLIALFFTRKYWVRPAVAWGALNAALLLMGLSMISPAFFNIVSKADNVPIVSLVFLLGFFTWLATSKAVANDERAKQGLPPLEKLDDEKILVWPDLVYTELICMVVVTVVLLVWAIGLKAPLEFCAERAKTPNPSKAPWYFLGLQEMLVYYDPWMAGVVLPSLVLFGLMAIPYIDFNKKGCGYYTIAQRKFAYCMFQIGFLELWVTLIVLGTFLRGPNWNFFGPFEDWDTHKVLALNNVNLSDYFWIDVLGASVPRVTSDMTGGDAVITVLKREGLGIVLLLIYFIGLPPVLASTVFRKMFVRMGFIRYMVMCNLLLFMTALPLKMVLRWTVNLKYIIYIPEIFLNF
ncbi:MAG: hypothetical protein HYS13_09810 [Planctomycetia bacterium]|nr:hypothetical protein [Planctomycetia bacterium]